MLSLRVKFDQPADPAPYLLSPYTLTLLHPLTLVRSRRPYAPAESHFVPSLAEEPNEKDILAFGYVSSAPLGQQSTLLLRTTDYRSANTRPAPAAPSPLQSILTKNAPANSFRMNTYVKTPGGGVLCLQLLPNHPGWLPRETSSHPRHLIPASKKRYTVTHAGTKTIPIRKNRHD